MTAGFQRALDDLAARDRLRQLAPRAGRDFSSNDYLGLASSPELRAAVATALDRGVPIGAGGSRLLRGNAPEHEALEAEAAAFFGSEAALMFGSGYLANVAIFSALPQRGDLVVHDAFIHASARDGMRLGRAELAQAPHNDVDAVAAAIGDWRRRGGMGQPWIAVESLYSMDGDIAPLDDLMAVVERHDGMLVIDEAHATGVLGPMGRGLGALLEGRDRVVSLHTCGKALGASGALVCAARPIRDFLINRARPFVFATGASPLMAAAVTAALRLCRDQPDRRDRLARLVGHAGDELLRRCGLKPSGTQILPVVVGTDRAALDLAHVVREAGYDVRAIRPPTVPEGTARLRLSITLNCTAADVTGVMDAVARGIKRGRD